MNGGRILIGCVAAFACLGTQADAARAQSWSTPALLSPRGGDTSRPAVAVGADGTMAVAWTAAEDDATRVLASVRPPGGEFGPAVELSRMAAQRGRPAVAVGAGGVVVVIWADVDEDPYGGVKYVRAAEGTAAGFGATRTLEQTDRPDDEPEAGVDAAGNVTLAWATNRGGRVVRRDADGTWTPVEVVAASVTNPQVLALGVAANGDAALVLAGATAVRESARGTFGPVQELYVSRDVEVAAGADGRMTAFWPDSGNARAADRGPDGGFGAPYTLNDRDWGTGIGFAPDGSSSAFTMTSLDQLLEYRRPAGGTWSAPSVFLDPAEQGQASGARGPLVAYDRGGTRYVAWHGVEPTVESHTVLAVVGSGPPQVVPSLLAGAAKPALAAGGPGEAVLAFVGRGGIQVSRWTTAPPEPADPPLPAVDPPAPADTPVPQGGPERAGRIVGAGVRAPLEKAWSLALTRPQPAPVLADGRLFLRVGAFDEDTNLPVVAYDVRTGAELWRAPHTRFSIADEVAYANGRVFVGGHESFALDAATGARLWTLPVYSDNPIVARDGRLILGGGQYTKSVDAASGVEQWSSPVGDEEGPSTVAAGRVFRASNDSAIAYDLASGALAWRQDGADAGDELAGAFDGGLMWVGSRAFDIRTGQIAHRSAFRGTVAIAAPLGYQIQGDSLVAFDLRTFETRWSFPVGSSNAWLYSSRPLVVDDLVFLAIGTRVHAVDRVTGAPVWTATLSDRALTGGLAAGSGHLVVPHQSGIDVFRTPSTGDAPASVADPVDAFRSDDDPVPAAAPRGADVGSAPSAAGPVRQAAALRTSARRSGRRVVVTVRGPARATGRVVVKVGRHSLTRSLQGGAVTVRVRLRRGERPARVAVRYAGDARFAPAQRTVKVRAS